MYPSCKRNKIFGCFLAVVKIPECQKDILSCNCNDKDERKTWICIVESLRRIVPVYKEFMNNTVLIPFDLRSNVPNL